MNFEQLSFEPSADTLTLFLCTSLFHYITSTYKHYN